MKRHSLKQSELRGGVVKLLPSPINDCAKDTIILLEGLLEAARKGNIVGLHGIAEQPDKTYFSFTTKTMSRLQVAGSLLEAAINRLKE